MKEINMLRQKIYAINAYRKVRPFRVDLDIQSAHAKLMSQLHIPHFHGRAWLNINS